LEVQLAVKPAIQNNAGKEMSNENLNTAKSLSEAKNETEIESEIKSVTVKWKS
jgi:hypothetical protein